MNRDFLTDELLEEAIRKACEQEYSMLDDVEEHEFSSEFEQEMEALINEKENKPIPFRRKRKIKFRYLLVAILSFALSYATVLAVEPAGEKIAGYMEKLRNNGVAYKTVETESNDVIAPNLIFFKYFPKEITKQEEFLYKYVDENNAICVLNFSGENNASLTCVKATPVFWDVYEFNIDWDSAIAQDISVAGYPAVLVTESSGRENIIYVRGGQVFMAGGTVGRDELVKVLESIDMFQ